MGHIATNRVYWNTVVIEKKDTTRIRVLNKKVSNYVLFKKNSFYIMKRIHH